MKAIRELILEEQKISVKIGILERAIERRNKKLLWSVNYFKKRLKSIRIGLAKAEARSRGEQVGAVKKRDDNKIIELRKSGLTYREIAKQLGCSVTPVQAALKNPRPKPSAKRKMK